MFLWLSIFQAIVVILCFIAIRNNSLELSRHQSVIIGMLLTVLITIEYWVFGSKSFSAVNSELDYGVTLMPLIANASSGFIPEFAGGIDISGEIFSGQIFSLELTMLKFIPFSLFHAIHKIMIVSIAIGGMYRLSRAFKIDRSTALAMAVLYALGHERMILVTWVHGLGFVLPALAAYLIVTRFGKKNYWLGVIFTALLTAISVSPVHSFPAIILVIASVFIIYPKKDYTSFVLAVIIIILAVVINWHNGLFTKFMLGQYTARGVSLSSFVRMVDYGYIAIGIIGSTIIMMNNRQRGLQAFTALILSGLTGYIILKLAQSVPALGVVRAINYNNMQTAFPAIACLLAAIGAKKASELPSLSISTKLATPLLVSLAIGQIAWFKAYTIPVLLSEGGLSNVMSAVDELKDAAWRPQNPTRIVSIPYKLPTNTPALAGFDTFDGGFAMILQSQENFWNAVVSPYKQKGRGGFAGFAEIGIDFKCCSVYSVNDFANIDVLRIANVGFIISRLPLNGNGVTLISNPNDNRIPTRNTYPVKQRIIGYIEDIINPVKIKVYAIDNPLPRVFAASAVVKADGKDNISFYKYIAQQTSNGVSVIDSNKWTEEQLPETGKINIINYVQSGEYFEIKLDAPENGLLVINQQWLPFWQAKTDNLTAQLFSINGIHMGIKVPAGTKTVTLKYYRPTLSDKLFAK